MMLVLLMPIVVSVTAAPLQQILDDRLIGQSKETLPVLPKIEIGSVKVDSKKPSRKQTPKVNGDSKETKSSQDLLPIPNQDDHLSSFPRTFPVLWENDLPLSKSTKKQPTTGRSSASIGSNKSQSSIINLQSGAIKSQTGIIKTQTGSTKLQPNTTELQPGTIKTLTGTPLSNKTPTGTIKFQSGTTKYLTERPVSNSKNIGTIQSQSGTTNLQLGTTKSSTQRSVTNQQTTGTIKSQIGTTKLQPGTIKTLTGTPVSNKTATGAIIFQSGTSKYLTERPVSNSQHTGTIQSQSGTTNLQLGTTKSSTQSSVANQRTAGTIKSQIGTKSSLQENEPEPEEGKVTKKGRKRKAFFLSYPFVPQVHHHYPTLPDYDLNFEDDFRTEERTPGGKKKYPESNIYYIRLPPTPYMFVPGLGYISQPPRYSPPPLSPHITHVRPMRPARPPTIYQPHVNPFIKVPIDFVSNGKPTSVYQWPSQDARPENRISNLDKGPYGFNGRPSSVYLLRPDGSQTASQNIRYHDYQDNRYY
ncbi:uncharacterized protein LOC117171526 [Belonocnema kinseyi]|uniref:uncharacterized protein LOC117171526 n=1 Tax=Belonocnema kinseyi TaxID=2817044 RepID=UPI00143D5C23|nr:uncharacterized protein LOC117171526 [Belonocnema kinseyi]